jgi:hypothetical protein
MPPLLWACQLRLRLRLSTKVCLRLPPLLLVLLLLLVQR